MTKLNDTSDEAATSSVNEVLLRCYVWEIRSRVLDSLSVLLVFAALALAIADYLKSIAPVANKIR